MIRLATLLALLAFPAAAETVNLCTGPHSTLTDQMTIAREEAGTIRLEFWNRTSPGGTGVSNNCARQHTFDGLTFTYSVRVGADAETYSVDSPPGYMADPPSVDVLDGDLPGVILLRLAMF